MRRLLSVMLITVVMLGMTAVAASSAPAIRYVAPGGSDDAAGTLDAPWRTLGTALERLQAGDTLYVRGGTYTERIRSPRLQAGTSSSPIRVQAQPGERPVLKGLLWLRNADHWIVDGLNVTWDPATGTSNEHMVKFTDGVGWSFRNAEVWGARSYAGLLVYGSGGSEPSGWSVTGNCIHDTYPSNDTNQDHNLYVNTGLGAGPGRVDRNIMFNATNGENIKLGGASSTSGGAANVIVRHNTLWNAAQNVMVAWTSTGNRLEGNLLGRTAGSYGTIRGFRLSGTGNVATGNLGAEAERFILNDAGYTGVRDAGDNVFPGSPSFDHTNDCSGFHPTDATASRYGRYAAAEGPTVSRLAGATRIETAVAVSRHSHPQGADVVLLARADDFPDALAGAPLASALDAPILLSGSDALSSATADEIRRLGARRAVLLGGTVALSAAVESGLRSEGVDRIERIAGATRYHTAAAIAQRTTDGHSTAAYVAAGRGATPDTGWHAALSVAPLAAAQGRPLLLVDPGTVPGATSDALRDLDVGSLTVVGGPAEIAEATVQTLAAIATVQRIGGSDVYATSAAVADLAERSGLRTARLWIANGITWPDALVSGPAIARSEGVLVLVDREDLARSPATRDWIFDRSGIVEELRVLGGEIALAPSVVDAILEASGG